jgi:hypothetical protein
MWTQLRCIGYSLKKKRSHHYAVVTFALFINFVIANKIMQNIVKNPITKAAVFTPPGTAKVYVLYTIIELALESFMPVLLDIPVDESISFLGIETFVVPLSVE